MSLPWVRLETGFPHNPKILALAADKHWQAITLYVSGLAYSGEQGTDGLVPFGALPFLHGNRKIAEQLVDVQLWKPARTGWSINGWTEFQQSDADTTRIKRRLSLGASKANCVRWHGPDCGCWEKGESA